MEPIPCLLVHTIRDGLGGVNWTASSDGNDRIDSLIFLNCLDSFVELGYGGMLTDSRESACVLRCAEEFLDLGDERCFGEGGAGDDECF